MHKYWVFIVLSLLFLTATVYAEDDLIRAGEYFNAKNFRKAGTYASKVLKKDPGNIQAGILLAESYSERGKVKPAIKVYKDMILKHPENVDLVFRMGLVYNKFEYHQNAADAYRQILATNKDHTLARYRLGLSLSLCMDLSGAYEEYRRLKPLDEKLAADLLKSIQTNN